LSKPKLIKSCRAEEEEEEEEEEEYDTLSSSLKLDQSNSLLDCLTI
jgi:hypothetical protein